jgi:hypothetical protein
MTDEETGASTDTAPRPDGGYASDDRDGSRSTTASAPASGVGDRLAALAADVSLSGGTSAVLALLASLLVGAQLVGLRLAALAVAAGTLVALGLAGLDSDRPLARLLAGAVLVPASILVLAGVGVGIAFGLRSGLAAGYLAVAAVLLLAVGSFAAVCTAAPVDGRGLLAGTFMRVIGIIVPLTGLQLLVAAATAPASTLAAVGALAFDSPEPLLAVGRALLAPRGPTALLTSVCYLVALVWIARALVGALPVVAVFPPRRRPEIAARVDDLRATLGRALFGTAAVGIGGYILALGAGVAAPARLGAALDPPLSGLVTGLLTAVSLRVLLLTLLGLGVAVLIAERLRRRVRRLSETDVRLAAMPPLGAAGTALGLGVVLELLLTPAAVVRMLPPALEGPAAGVLDGGLLAAAFLAAFASLVVLGALLLGLAVLVGSPALPDRALGPALAATGVFGLGLMLAVFGGPSALSVLAAVVALVVWDAGEFAAGLRTELGTDAHTRRGELVHVGGSLAVGVAALWLALALELLVASGAIVPMVPDTALAAGALAIAFGTVVLLLSALRE